MMTNETTKYKEKALWKHTEQIILQPTETTTITLPSTIKSAAKSFYFTQDIVKNGASDYQYSVKSAINCKISYKSEKLKNENYMVLFNRDIEEKDGVFTNASILTLQGNDIDSITLTISNHHETETLTINSLAIYESDDIKTTQLVKAFKEDVVVSNMIMATSIIVDNGLIMVLETGIKDRDARVAKEGDEVHWRRIAGSDDLYGVDVLGSEQEQLIRTLTIAGKEYTYAYWWTAIEGEDAYKHLMTYDPLEFDPEMPDSEREKYKYMVLKPKDSSVKKSVTFAKNANGNHIPTDIYGRGTDDLGLGNGQGFIWKDENGFYHIYQQSDGETCGIVMDEQGVHITGWADQHCEEVRFKRNGVYVKFTGEEGHRWEYVYNDSGETMTGLLQDQSYLTVLAFDDEPV